MKVLKCTNCGSHELTDHGNYAICDFCRSHFAYNTQNGPASPSNIGVASDIDALLQKCQEDPLNRRRYASLILDIDPTNRKAQDYLL